MKEKQEKFLDALFGEAQGDPRTAMDIAGYASTTPIKQVTTRLADEIEERNRRKLSDVSTKAIFKLEKVLDKPTTPGARELLAASKDVLDRNNYKPKEEVEVDLTSTVFLLPPKS